MIEKFLLFNRKFINDILNGYAIIGLSIIMLLILIIGNIVRAFL